MTGSRVGVAFEGWLPAGSHPLTVDGASLGSGVYWFEAVSSAGERLVARGVLVR